MSLGFFLLKTDDAKFNLIMDIIIAEIMNIVLKYRKFIDTRD